MRYIHNTALYKTYIVHGNSILYVWANYWNIL